MKKIKTPNHALELKEEDENVYIKVDNEEYALIERVSVDELDLAKLGDHIENEFENWDLVVVKLDRFEYMSDGSTCKGSK
jgi:hypothetical protein